MSSSINLVANTNWSYVLSILVISCGGIPKGYDEGGYSSSVRLPSFQNDFDLVPSEWSNNPDGLANRTGNITSLASLGSAFGALFAMWYNDRFGRLKTWRCSGILWACGAVMQCFASGDYGFLLFARIWTGVGAGALTAVSPMFLAEIAGTKGRGLVVSCYMAMLLLWFTLGYFINYAAAATLNDTLRLQYRVVQAAPLIPTGLAWIASFAIFESPRWLVSKDRIKEAQEALSRLRGDALDSPAIEHEMSHLANEARNDSITFKENGGLLGAVKETFLIDSLRYRLLLVWLMQTVAQWSGGQAVSFYIPQIFDYAGLTSSSSDIISSGVYGIIKFVVTIIFAVVLIDIIGRRPCMLVGLFLQLCAHVYLAVFTALKPTDNHSASQAAIASVFIYAIGYSVGLCTIQFLYASEVFPTRIRSFAYATTTSLHWFFQFALVKAVPVMFVKLDVWGTFVFFACICAIGLVALGIAAPETKRVPNEHMDVLFSGRWFFGFKARVPSNFQTEREDSESSDTKKTRDMQVEYATPDSRD